MWNTGIFMKPDLIFKKKPIKEVFKRKKNHLKLIIRKTKAG